MVNFNLNYNFSSNPENFLLTLSQPNALKFFTVAHQLFKRLDEATQKSIARTNKTWNVTWKTITQKKIEIFQGEHDTYLIINHINRQETKAIKEQTQMDIRIRSYLKQVNDFKLPFMMKNCKIGFAALKAQYVSIETLTQSYHKFTLTESPSVFAGSVVKDFSPGSSEILFQKYKVRPLTCLQEVKNIISWTSTADKAFQEQVAFYLFDFLIQKVAHFHEQGYTSLQLDMNKIVIDLHGEPYLIDFEDCINKQKIAEEYSQKELEIRRYCLPEYSLCDPLTRLKHPEKIDSWTLGCVLLELFSMPLPFKSKELDSIREAHESDQDQDAEHREIEEYFSKALASVISSDDNCKDDHLDLIKKLMQTNPAERMSIKEALNHPWFVKMRKTSQAWQMSIKGFFSNFITKHQHEQLRFDFSLLDSKTNDKLAIETRENVCQSLAQKKEFQFSEDDIDLITVYLMNEEISLDDYLKHFIQMNQMTVSESSEEKSEKSTAVFRITIELLKNKYPLAFQLFNRLSYFADEHIPRKILTSIDRSLVSLINAGSLEILEQFGLINIEGNSVFILSDGQAQLRSQHSEEEKKKYLSEGAQILNRAYKYPVETTKQLRLNKELLPHQEHLINSIDTSSLIFSNHQTFSIVELLGWLADNYFESEMYQEQYDSLQKALKLAKPLYTENDKKMGLFLQSFRIIIRKTRLSS